jgi:copper resistance protein B
MWWLACALIPPAFAQQGHEHDMGSMAGMDMGSTPAPVADNGHVAPPAPVTSMAPMTAARMAAVMQMHDDAVHSLTRVEELEAGTNAPYAAWNAGGLIGGDVNRFAWRTEGEHERDGTRDASVEALYSHAVSAFWDGQAGVRHDFGHGPSREWVAVGVQGLAPYWLDVQATAYAGEQGRAAARVEVSYEVLFSQRLILTPKIEVNAYGKADPGRELGRGISDIDSGLRLRYEVDRRFAPYIGVRWDRLLGDTADLARGRGERAARIAWLAGVRMWL